MTDTAPHPLADELIKKFATLDLEEITALVADIVEHAAGCVFGRATEHMNDKERTLHVSKATEVANGVCDVGAIVRPSNGAMMLGLSIVLVDTLRHRADTKTPV